MSFKEILAAVKESVSAIFRGEFLLRLHIVRLFPHILFTFLVMWMSILMDMRVEKTMVELERSKSELNDMRILHAHKTVQMVSLNRISTVQGMLESKGSEVTLPEKPAAVIRK